MDNDLESGFRGAALGAEEGAAEEIAAVADEVVVAGVGFEYLECVRNMGVYLFVAGECECWEVDRPVSGTASQGSVCLRVSVNGHVFVRGWRWLMVENCFLDFLIQLIKNSAVDWSVFAHVC